MLNFNRRLMLVIMVVVLAFLAIGFRLVDLQVVSGEEIKAKHEAEYGGTQELEPIRGPILDRNESVLAVTGFEYRISASPPNIDDVRSVADVLATALVTRTYSLMPLLDPPPHEDGTPRLYSVVAPRISSEVADEVRQSIEANKLPGIALEPIQHRYYPHGQLLSHVLGWVDIDMNGRSGVEGYYDRELKGEGVTVRQYPMLFGQLETPRPHNGAALVLTVDRTVQLVAERVLEDALTRYRAPSGTIIVMDPRTFGILALANLPTFDPNLFYKEDPKYMVDPAVSQRFEPGSIHKVLTMAAAIDSGTVTPGTTYEDKGVVQIGGVEFYNWDRASHGVTDMVTLLAKSLNVGAATIARWMGQQTFYGYMDAFKLAEPTGVDLTAEVGGVLRRPNDTDWTEADLGATSFGQAFAITPLRELGSIAVIANSGVMLRPHFVSEIRDGDAVHQVEPVVLGQPISAETARTVAQMMEQAVAREVPTANVPGYSVAGKTGTAQIAEGGVVYHQTDVIGTFIGFLPADDPQVIVLVKIDRPQISLDLRWGSMTAAPTFAELMQQLVVLLDIPPDAARVQNQMARMGQ